MLKKSNLLLVFLAQHQLENSDQTAMFIAYQNQTPTLAKARLCHINSRFSYATALLPSRHHSSSKKTNVLFSSERKATQPAVAYHLALTNIFC